MSVVPTCLLVKLEGFNADELLNGIINISGNFISRRDLARTNR